MKLTFTPSALSLKVVPILLFSLVYQVNKCPSQDKFNFKSLLVLLIIFVSIKALRLVPKINFNFNVNSAKS